MGKNTLSLREDKVREDQSKTPKCPDCRAELEISIIPDETVCPVCEQELRCWFGKWKVVTS